MLRPDLWSFTEVLVNLDNHVFEHFADDEKALHAMVEAYTLQDLQVTREKPVWEIHLFKLRMADVEAKHIQELERKEHHEAAEAGETDSVSSSGSFVRKMSR